MSSEEDRAAITELFNKKQALMIELQHYEANFNSASGSTSVEDRSSTAMPTNTRLQVAVTPSIDEVSKDRLLIRFRYLEFLYSQFLKSSYQVRKRGDAEWDKCITTNDIIDFLCEPEFFKLQATLSVT